MRKRTFSQEYKYGQVLDNASQLFKKNLYQRIGLKKLFFGKKVLDLGCGFGTDSIILAKFSKKVVGFDIDKYEEWKLFKNKKIEFVKGDSSKMPFKDNTFDGVYLKDLLHHVKNVGKTIDEIKRVTKAGGYITILEGNRYNPLFFILITKIRGHDHFTQKEFKKIMNSKFDNCKILNLEAYPPFFLKASMYKHVLKIERAVERLTFLRPFFTYNIAVIKNSK